MMYLGHKKNVLITLLFLTVILTAIFAFADHENFLIKDWTDPYYDQYKTADVCKCFSNINTIIKNRDSKIDAVGLVLPCYTYCKHCEPKAKEKNPNPNTVPFHVECMNKCFTTPQFKTEISIISCIDSCKITLCKEQFSLKYVPSKVLLEQQTANKPETLIKAPIETVKEVPKIEPVVIPPTSPVKIPEPTPLSETKISDNKCKTTAQKTLQTIGQENYCKTAFLLSNFTEKIKEEFKKTGNEKDYDDCSPFTFSSEFELAKSACPAQSPPQLVKKVVKINWPLVLEITGGILGFIILIVIILLIRKRMKYRSILKAAKKTEEHEETAEKTEEVKPEEPAEEPEIEKTKEEIEEEPDEIKVNKVDLVEKEEPEHPFSRPKIEVPPIREKPKKVEVKKEESTGKTKKKEKR